MVVRATSHAPAQAATEIPHVFSGFEGLHAGETLVVCGCGTSLAQLTEPERFVTIGVNDVGRLFDPDYLVVLNPPQQFMRGRYQYVLESRAKALFTHLPFRGQHPNVIRIALGERRGTEISPPNKLPYSNNSPYVALCLAMFMGARRIGLIGVDLTNHHFFARTGRHQLANRFDQIDREYHGLARAAADRGIEIVNLSQESKLTTLPKMSIEEFARGVKLKPSRSVAAEPKKIFFVNYKFLSCGEVFTNGIRHAADDLGMSHRAAYWDDRSLPAKVRDYDPDLLFVVHGRKFVRRWGNRFSDLNSAVWLLDEPYEVDETSRWSGGFDTVFVNDASTLDRHPNAHYLPVGLDQKVHFPGSNARKYDVGFIGGYNRRREELLLRLLDEGVLSYVVGGPWRSKRLQKVCLSPNIPAGKTAALYRETKIIVNIFREVHHYNKAAIPAQSMNPRIYEALGCGALVVSEPRQEVRQVFPDLPVLASESQIADLVREYLNDDNKREAALARCSQSLETHSYAQRLSRAVEIAANSTEKGQPKPIEVKMNEHRQKKRLNSAFEDWVECGGAAKATTKRHVLLEQSPDGHPGAERGLASALSYEKVELEFDLKLEKGATFVAKVHQQHQLDQRTNSYHLFCGPDSAYLAMHNRVFCDVPLKRGVWQKIHIRRLRGEITLTVDDIEVARVRNTFLKRGYCFVGVKGGAARVRDLRVATIGPTRIDDRGMPFEGDHPDFKVLRGPGATVAPAVSIITTVYDRVECLRECLNSVSQQRFGDWEQIVVADHPPDRVFRSIQALIEESDDERLVLANLVRRHNNWGIAPADAGLRLARGRYVCFLSDDNGYTADHLQNLVHALDENPRIGFAYSSCFYAGRLVLRTPRPMPARIDLGQPLFRRELFDEHFEGRLPFQEMAWDWRMIQTFLRCGVLWRHINKATFLFRLRDCNAGRRKAG